MLSNDKQQRARDDSVCGWLHGAAAAGGRIERALVTTMRFLAMVMGAAQGTLWLLAARWEAPGREVDVRARLPRPPAWVRAGYFTLVVPLVYPAVVAIAPGWGYAGPLNWSSPVDAILQGLGVAAWTAGVCVLVWASRAMGHFTGIDGVAEGQELVTSGPYRYVRHPIYACFTLVVIGLALTFRSYLLVAVTAVWLVASLWWVSAEEALLSSAEGFGDRYQAYRRTTGRFLPRVRP
ncbi:methyltransferase [Kribbella shirazensis]|uniref:Protein-S-isoprenylcysteine O-methyltransferase Ste14 n=1 Tax=Kribbella shirazensis TaxID=1105143 RepID=A0A7X5VFB5_9ACTN|nr:protein-S-isoprenylcysteine O-methyltransferase Ste14 [Kribbella shirazensis]